MTDGWDQEKGPPGAVSRIWVLDSGDPEKRRQDTVAVEEPLELRVVADHDGGRRGHSVAVTMRTPGSDFELAAGFLLSEGIVEDRAQVWRLARCESASLEDAENIIEVHLAPGVRFDPERFSRHLYTTSSCGICSVKRAMTE